MTLLNKTFKLLFSNDKYFTHLNFAICCKSYKTKKKNKLSFEKSKQESQFQKNCNKTQTNEQVERNLTLTSAEENRSNF